jgi:site-specific DNA recombinase
VVPPHDGHTCGHTSRWAGPSFCGRCPLKSAIYVRVSAADQNPELQIRELRDYAVNHGWEIVETYQDIMSGSNASLPGLNRLMEDAEERKFVCVLVRKLDRFGRSLVDCLNNIRTLENHGIRFIALRRTLTPTSGIRPPVLCCMCWEPQRNSRGS